jgi:hypothetical protein
MAEDLSNSPKVDIGGTASYRPGPDLRNGARVFRELAAQPEIKGSRYLLIGSMIFTAFCIEAFCQAYGPEILGQQLWCEGMPLVRKGRPAESWPVLEKLKRIGRKVGVIVSYGESPWKDMKQVMVARDRLAHPRPENRGIRIAGVGVDDDHHALFHRAIAEKYEPLISAKRLEEIAKKTDEGIATILRAAGYHDYDAEIMQFSQWGAKVSDEQGPF